MLHAAVETRLRGFVSSQRQKEKSGSGEGDLECEIKLRSRPEYTRTMIIHPNTWEGDMSRSINKVILIGNAGRDPDIQTTAAGTKVAHLSLATSRRIPRKRR